MAEKQTAGRDYLGKLAPKFAELNDDVLFGEVWAREDKLSARDRSMITIAALFSAGLYPQLKSHLELGKKHGITKEEAVDANFPGFYNSNHTADRFSASRISFMHDFPEMRGSQL